MEPARYYYGPATPAAYATATCYTLAQLAARERETGHLRRYPTCPVTCVEPHARRYGAVPPLRPLSGLEVALLLERA